MIKTIIIDDSHFMRTTLSKILKKSSEIEISGVFRNGKESLKYLESNSVDVILLDFIMPGMSGIEILKEIMSKYPTPTIILTGADKEQNPDLFLDAYNYGVFDIIQKPTGSDKLNLVSISDHLINKVLEAGRYRKQIQSRRKIIPEKKNYDTKNTEENKTNLNKSEKKQQEKTNQLVQKEKQEKSLKTKRIENIIINGNSTLGTKLIIIGASTGGPSLLTQLIKNLKFKPNHSLIVIQHMPRGFTQSFAERLDKISPYKIIEAENNMKLEGGKGYVAPGNYHLILKKINNSIYIILDDGPKIQNVRPSIDVTMESAAPIFKEHCIGIVLTGMGRDGTNGLKAIKKNGGITYCQDPNEAFISSMPKSAIDQQVVDNTLPAMEIIAHINQIY